MEKRIRVAVAFCVFAAAVLVSAQARPGLLNPDEVKKAVPSMYFFRGQSAGVQVRNTAGFRAQEDKLVLAGFVDTSGYASDVQAKYQGLLITEVKLDIDGKDLPPGEYGFGFSKDGKLLVMDVGANDLFSVSAHMDDGMTHPVPLKMVADGGGYRLYAGKKWVGCYLSSSAAELPTFGVCRAKSRGRAFAICRFAAVAGDCHLQCATTTGGPTPAEFL